MTDSSISIPNTTKLVDTVQITSDVGVVQRQVCAIGDPSVADGLAEVSLGGQLSVYTSKVLDGNGSTTPLNAAATFTGTGVDVSGYPSVVCAVYTDQAGTLYMDFSPDGTNWDSSLSFSVAASTNEVHRLSVTRKYFRARFTNTSASNQTFLRMQAIAGAMPALSAPLNGVIQRDADAATVRSMDFNLMASAGLYQNFEITLKEGINSDIDTGSVPEDVTNEGGVYAGFPTGSPEAGQIVVAGADTGTVYYSYLASSSDTDYTFASKAVAGAGTYALGHNIWRCNYAYFVGASGAVNAGAITVQNTPTTANIFCVIDAGIGQTYCAAYTVPAGSSIFLDRINGSLRGSATGSLDGYFWYRPLGESPRLRFPFELQYGSLYFDDIDYLIKIPQQVDMIPRIITSSTTNLVAKVSYRFAKIKS